MNKKRITITTDESTVEALKEISEKESRNLSQQISMILKEYLEQRAAQK